MQGMIQLVIRPENSCLGLFPGPKWNQKQATNAMPQLGIPVSLSDSHIIQPYLDGRLTYH